LLNRVLEQILYKAEQEQGVANLVEDDKNRNILTLELQNMLFRVNTIKTWVTLKLKEFEANFRQVYEILDDWVVVAVTQENKQCEALLK